MRRTRTQAHAPESGGSPAPAPPRLPHLTSKPRAPARTYSRAACAGFGHPSPPNAQRTDAGAPPPPHPRAPAAAAPTLASVRGRAALSRPSPMRPSPLGRCRACPRSTYALWSCLSALPRVLLLYVLPTRARWARGGGGSAGGCPPASPRGLRPRQCACPRPAPAPAIRPCATRSLAPCGRAPLLRRGDACDKWHAGLLPRSSGLSRRTTMLYRPAPDPRGRYFVVNLPRQPTDETHNFGGSAPKPPVC